MEQRTKVGSQVTKSASIPSQPHTGLLSEPIYRGTRCCHIGALSNYSTPAAELITRSFRHFNLVLTYLYRRMY